MPLDRRFLLGFALGALAVGAGARTFSQADAQGGIRRESFDSAVDIVLERYVEPVDADAVMTRGLKHMVRGLDGYSSYLTADERKLARRKLRSGAGTGLTVAMRRRGGEDRLEVLAVAPGSTAMAAGLGPGDVVLEVAGRPIADLLSQAEAEILLAGEEGETVDLVVQRRRDTGPRPLALELTRPPARDAVETQIVERRGRKYALVRIRAFRSGTGEAVKRGLEEARRASGDAGLSGVVLDVRGNPGGEVAEALVVADLFVAQGVLTRTRGRGGRILREERAHLAGTDTGTPLVVLQDRHSASASELLAVALQDHGRARIVGEPSYGKGTVQDVIGMEDGSVLTLTIARYFSPGDRMVDGAGVTPDVPRVLSSLPEDAVVEAALSAL
jgi:carboxyl-terminal processing protease